MKIIRYISLCVTLLILCGGSAEANTVAEQSVVLMEADSANLSKLELRRVDREINKLKFIYRGEAMFGSTMSYYTLSGDNADFMLLLTGITAEASLVTVKPYFAYFYRDNRAVGARFGYTKMSGMIDSATVDLGETNDIEMDIPYVSLLSTKYAYSIFHRSYAALDAAGHFGVFADIEFETAMGKSTYGYESDGEKTSSYSKNKYFNISFNPGMSVFVMHNVSATISFELGGVSYTRIDQYNSNHELIGSREASKMRFMFNVLAVNFGLNFHIW